MHDLTAFQRDCLMAIGQMDEPKGLAIKDNLDEFYHKDVGHGRLYPNLDTLVKKGLVHKGKINDRTNMYTLTDRGRRELIAYDEELHEVVEKLQTTA